MTVLTTLRDINEDMKDIYAPGGTLLKQWVVDLCRNQEWERETCPSVGVPKHDNDTEYECKHSTSTVRWTMLHDRDCKFCKDLQDSTFGRPDVAEWRAERDARPPICADRTQLSDETQPHVEMRDGPFFAMIRKAGPK